MWLQAMGRSEGRRGVAGALEGGHTESLKVWIIVFSWWWVKGLGAGPGCVLEVLQRRQ